MNAYIIRKPVITEKALFLAQKENKYTFEVNKLATKDQIRAVVEELFSVDVLAVNTIRRNKSIKRTGRKRKKVTVPQYKKAVIELKKGQKIEMFDFTPQEGGK